MREVDLEGQIVRQITLTQLNAALAAAGYSVFKPPAFIMICFVSAMATGFCSLNEYRDFQDLPGYPGTTSVLGDDMVDLDPNNQPVWVWRAFDHLDVNRHPYLFPDWTHSNAIVLRTRWEPTLVHAAPELDSQD